MIGCINHFSVDEKNLLQKQLKGERAYLGVQFKGAANHGGEL